jgi:hypothetical protein
MGGNTGKLRTLRLSSTSGSRTLGSLVADGASAGAGSMRRVYADYMRRNQTPVGFYSAVFGLNYGEFRNNLNMFISSSGFP